MSKEVKKIENEEDLIKKGNSLNLENKIGLSIILLINIFFIFGILMSIQRQCGFTTPLDIMESFLSANLGKFLFVIGLNITFLIIVLIKKKKEWFSVWILLMIFLFPLGVILKIGYNNTIELHCDQYGDAKPAVYIYPTKTTDISVKLKIKGRITKVIPDYNGEWKVRVKPNGQMKVIGGNSQITYDYLFYENTVNKIDEPKEGWVIKNDKKEIAKFYNSILYKIGFNENEANEFIDYWVPKLTKDIDNNFILVKQFSREYLDSNMEIIIEPKPDKMLRVEFLYEGIDKKINIKKPKLKEFKREGYFSVEWGGIVK